MSRQDCARDAAAWDFPLYFAPDCGTTKHPGPRS